MFLTHLTLRGTGISNMERFFKMSRPTALKEFHKKNLMTRLASGPFYDTFGLICMPSLVTDTLNPETAIFNRNRLEQNHLEKKLTAKIKNSPPYCNQ